MIKSNFHTHSVYCDGADTVEDMVLEAISKGFTHLGFSGHGFSCWDTSYCMTKEGTADYLKEIDRVRDKFSGQINIYSGIEKDYFSSESNSDFQYVIGSVHYILKDGVYYPVDISPDGLKSIIDAFDGDYIKSCKQYFETEADVIRKTDCDIIGHFDLISKYMAYNNIEITPEYLKLAEAAVDALIPYNKPFEINTGAIARGINHGIYPSIDILKMIYDRGGKIILSSDCHNKHFLDCYFKECLEILKELNFKSLVSFQDNCFNEFGIDEFSV